MPQSTHGFPTALLCAAVGPAPDGRSYFVLTFALGTKSSPGTFFIPCGTLGDDGLEGLSDLLADDFRFLYPLKPAGEV